MNYHLVRNIIERRYKHLRFNIEFDALFKQCIIALNNETKLVIMFTHLNGIWTQNINFSQYQLLGGQWTTI